MDIKVELLENVEDLGIAFRTYAPINQQFRIKPFSGLEVKGADFLKEFEYEGLSSGRDVGAARIVSEQLRFSTRISLTPIFVKGKKPLIVKSFIIGQKGWADEAVE